MKQFTRVAMLALILLWGGGAYVTQAYAADEQVVYYEPQIKTPNLGNYQFEVNAYEKPSHETLPIVSSDYFPTTVAKFATEVDNTAPSATYKAKPITKVDVVFALGELAEKTKISEATKTFEAQLNSASNKLDTKVQAVETIKSELSGQGYNVDTIINSWDVIGANIWVASGNEIYCNPNNSWWGTAMLSPDGYESTETTYRIKVDSTGELCDGICFNVTRNGNYISGYFINFGGHGTASCHLYRFDNYNINTAFDQGINQVMWCGWHDHGYSTHTVPGFGSFTMLAQWDVRSKVVYEASAKDGNIVVKRDGNIIASVTDKTYTKGTFGLWGNNCEAKTSMKLSDIYVSYGKTVIKTLGESISDVAWRDNSVRFVVHATDIVPPDMLDRNGADYQYTITKLYNSNAYLVNLGTPVNKSVLEQLIRDITGIDGELKGTFVYNYPVNASMSSSVNYILSKVNNLAKPTGYILVDTDMTWETQYDDYERDLPLNFGENTEDGLLASSWGVGLTHLYNGDKLMAEKWRYRHNPTHYDNSVITAGFSNTWIADPITSFKNPGLYRVNYKRRDNPFNNASISNPFDNYRYWSTDYDTRVNE